MSQNFKRLQKNFEGKKKKFESKKKIWKATQFFESTTKRFSSLQFFLRTQPKNFQAYNFFYECRKNICQHRKKFVSILKKTARPK